LLRSLSGEQFVDLIPCFDVIITVLNTRLSSTLKRLACGISQLHKKRNWTSWRQAAGTTTALWKQNRMISTLWSSTRRQFSRLTLITLKPNSDRVRDSLGSKSTKRLWSICHKPRMHLHKIQSVLIFFLSDCTHHSKWLIIDIHEVVCVFLWLNEQLLICISSAMMKSRRLTEKSKIKKTNQLQK